MDLESLFAYLDDYLQVGDHPDYRTALNGVQVQGPPDRVVRRLAAAVDVSEATIEAAVRAGAEVLVVHHGLFWGGLQPLTGRLYRKVRALIEGGVALYSAHLPLDAHPEVGNGILLARALELADPAPFGRYEETTVGWIGRLAAGEHRDAFRARVSEAVQGGPVTVIAGGGGEVRRVAVVTGGGGSFIEQAAAAGADALVTGEGSHHTYVEARELGLDVYYAGHYATETFGVRALCSHLAERYRLDWVFLDDPSGL
jgi:dinuclear metal center YbgI/SA1388 family protein